MLFFLILAIAFYADPVMQGLDQVQRNSNN